MKLNERNKAYILECLRNAVQYGDKMFVGESIKSNFAGYMAALVDGEQITFEQSYFLRLFLDCVLYRHDHCENPEQEKDRYNQEWLEKVLEMANQLNND